MSCDTHTIGVDQRLRRLAAEQPHAAAATARDQAARAGVVERRERRGDEIELLGQAAADPDHDGGAVVGVAHGADQHLDAARGLLGDDDLPAHALGGRAHRLRRRRGAARRRRRGPCARRCRSCRRPDSRSARRRRPPRRPTRTARHGRTARRARRAPPPSRPRPARPSRGWDRRPGTARERRQVGLVRQPGRERAQAGQAALEDRDVVPARPFEILDRRVGGGHRDHRREDVRPLDGRAQVVGDVGRQAALGALQPHGVVDRRHAARRTRPTRPSAGTRAGRRPGRRRSPSSRPGCRRGRSSGTRP